MVARTADEPSDVAQVRSMFARFASGHADLPLYAAICRAVAHDDEAAALLLAAPPGQRRPVLWLAAVHDLVLSDRTVPAAQWYGSATEQASLQLGDPWPAVRQTVLEHRAALSEVIATSSTQTNEVNRAVYLAAGLGASLADLHSPEVALVEMGTSAGLLLLLDRYRIEQQSSQGTRLVGDRDSPVVCVGEDRSDPRPATKGLPTIAARAGIDLHPIALDDTSGLRWLEACLWPDVPGRVERFRAAVELAREQPPTLVCGDMVDDLAQVIAVAQGDAAPGTHVVVFSSWALTYVARDRRRDVAAVLAAIAATGTAVSWVTAEPPGCVPGIPLPPGHGEGNDATVLGLRRWRNGVETPSVMLGTCHPHGQWLDLHEEPAGR